MHRLAPVHHIARARDPHEPIACGGFILGSPTDLAAESLTRVMAHA